MNGIEMMLTSALKAFGIDPKVFIAQAEMMTKAAFDLLQSIDKRLEKIASGQDEMRKQLERIELQGVQLTAGGEYLAGLYSEADDPMKEYERLLEAERKANAGSDESESAEVETKH